MSNQTQLEQTLLKNDYVVVKFYLEHCNHCQQLSPRFYDLSDLTPQNVRLVQFNCNVDKVTCNKYNVDGVPSIQLFKSTDFISSYENIWRDPKPMLEWIISNMK